MASITVNGSNSGQTISGDNNVITVEPGGPFVVRVNGNTNNISGGTGPNTYATQGTNNSITVGGAGGTFTALGDTTQVTANQGAVTGTIQGDDSAFTGGDNPIRLRVIGDRGTLVLPATNTNANTFLLQGDGFVFTAGAGADTIAAVGTDDFLSGAGGADTFAFAAGNDAFGTPDLSAPTVQDFDAATAGERIAVLIAPNAAYGASLSDLGLTAQSALDPARFEVGTAATSAATRFVYDPANGRLLFTPFGNAQAASDVVATLGRNLSLTADRIYISNPTNTLSAEQSPLAGLPGGDPFAAPSGGTGGGTGGFTVAPSQGQAQSVTEGNSGTTPYTFTVERTNTSAAAALTYTVLGTGTNPALADQFPGGVLPTGTVTFAAGDASETVTIPIQGNTTREGDTVFQVALTGTGGADIAALGFIGDDDNYQIFTGTAGADTFADAAPAAPFDGSLYVGNGGRDVLSVANTFRGATTGVAPNGDVVLVHRGHTDVLRGLAEADFVDGRLVFDPNDVAAQVVRMYQAGLGRDPDQDGLNFWIGRLQQGATPGQIAQGFLASPEGISRFGSNPSDTEFVTRIYVNVLGRDPEQGGLNFWVGRLQEGATRQDVLAGIAESAENKTRTAPSVAAGIWDLDEGAAQVARMYDTALGRLPDLGGLDFWTRNINAGQLTLQDMANQFVGSTEFQMAYPSPSNREFVQTIYQNTLDRPGDQGGIDYWTGRLDQGATRAQVVTGFSESAEHQRLTAPNIASNTPGQYGILTV